MTGGRRAVLTAAALAVLFPAVPAQATPPSSSAEAARLVAERAHDLEVVTERFNDARVTLATAQATATAATARADQATAALAAVRTQVRSIARSAYTGHATGTLQTLMDAGSAEEFVDRAGTLQTIAAHQDGVLEQAKTAEDDADEARDDAEHAAATAQTQVDTVARQQTDLTAQIADFQAAFDRLSAQERRAALAAAQEHASQQPAQQPAADSSPAAKPATRAPAQQQRTGSPPPQAAAPAPTASASGAAAKAVSVAMAQRGKPYHWAAAGPGSFDCSGLTMFAYQAAGIALPHSSKTQAGSGRSVSRDQLQPGDLVLFYSPVSHIGMYIGGGQMVHAPTSGDVVKVASIDMGGYAGARRVS